MAHLRQSITDILTTPKGSRVERREYGSDLFSLIDAPLNRSKVMDIRAAVAVSLEQWEPRFGLNQCDVASAQPGQIVLTLYGVYLPDGTAVTLDGIEVA